MLQPTKAPNVRLDRVLFSNQSLGLAACTAQAKKNGVCHLGYVHAREEASEPDTDRGRERERERSRGREVERSREREVEGTVPDEGHALKREESTAKSIAAKKPATMCLFNHTHTHIHVHTYTHTHFLPLPILKKAKKKKKMACSGTASPSRAATCRLLSGPRRGRAELQ